MKQATLTVLALFLSTASAYRTFKSNETDAVSDPVGDFANSLADSIALEGTPEAKKATFLNLLGPVFAKTKAADMTTLNVADRGIICTWGKTYGKWITAFTKAIKGYNDAKDTISKQGKGKTEIEKLHQKLGLNFDDDSKYPYDGIGHEYEKEAYVKGKADLIAAGEAKWGEVVKSAEPLYDVYVRHVAVHNQGKGKKDKLEPEAFDKTVLKNFCRALKPLLAPAL
mmetsp:Transcript_10842/g.19820  ORF Transcript_10842/g.19820 Transcript_10842/m.19820 type:complete len:226 (+) Transcript_10842:92-769(+)|eukprot:CAMPEP_0197537960 /NCGR_PEP_ID=MMETSP1318-20131121/58403_1 /TAXON_ID=552666 /ORGANISM="Partenskyella glossopodia, Strain RCC365" /LENGTH=225 /DNA_ID=CAMNT_0043096247 /DNA_START=88 /DNA_END=765 /DNA_ORIENTATION=+